MGARQHLAVLAGKGLVEEGEQQKLGRGRPVRLWRLTATAQQRFPDSHSQVSVELIAAVRDTFGETGLDKLIDRRTQHTLAHYRTELEKLSQLGARVKRLSELRSREGYMAECEKVGKGEWLLVENHCPICAAASACQGFCRSELEVFQQLFSGMASVERTSHILQGARRCAYKITEQ